MEEGWRHIVYVMSPSVMTSSISRGERVVVGAVKTCANDSLSSSSSVGESVRGILVGVDVDGLRREETREVVDVKSV